MLPCGNIACWKGSESDASMRGLYPTQHMVGCAQQVRDFNDLATRPPGSVSVDTPQPRT